MKKLLLAAAVATALVLPSAAQAHRVNSTYVIPYIKSSNAGGWCGRGDWVCTGGKYIVASLYYGGDGNPAVGDHSWQFRISYVEKYFGVAPTRNCEIIERWYHYSYGEAYQITWPDGHYGYRNCW